MNSKIRPDNGYRVIIEELKPEQAEVRTLQFEYQDREDMFKVVDNIKQGSGLDELLATRLSVSLRLLGPVMVKNRKHPLFVDFILLFDAFMQNLKNTDKKSCERIVKSVISSITDIRRVSQ